jgi:preprotein translocase subunit SecB
MAEQTAENNAANGASADPAGLGQAPQLIINTQYVKDLSFENPRAPQSLLGQQKQPELGLDVDVKARTLGGEMYEVLLTISADAKAENEPVFIVQLTYGAVITVRNAGQDMLPGLILVETPRLMFPFARAVIAQATRDGGFPPLLINMIDFADLIRRQQAKLAAQAATGTATA